MSQYVGQLLSNIAAKNPHEPEFIQAVTEVLESVELVVERHPEYRDAKIPTSTTSQTESETAVAR